MRKIEVSKSIISECPVCGNKELKAMRLCSLKRKVKSGLFCEKCETIIYKKI